MQPAQHIYETTFIVNASVDDSQIESAIGRVQDVVTKNGGTIHAVNKWGRRRLAYPISKKTTGFYCHVEFEATGALIGLLERSYQLDELILRYLTVRLSKNALKARAQALARAQEAVETAGPADLLPPEPTTEKGESS
jgi:small subunit ribosomal protein S6